MIRSNKHFSIAIFRKSLYAVALSVVVVLLMASCKNKTSGGSDGTPEEGLASYKVADGFKIELIASEPLINSPVDMMVDEYGRMYVVLMPGYPLDVKGSGKIVLLSDTDSDGRMDKSVVFAEGLTLPTGIVRWKKGVLVTDAPNILYFEDTDGDGKSDVRDTVLAGFALTNPQHNLNNPIYALDNWIYVANQGAVKTEKYAAEFGGRGSDVYFKNDSTAGHLPQNAGNVTFRFRPDNKKIELTSSRCQFGHTFDVWGHWFGCNNSNHGYQEVIARRYFERNPNLMVSDANQSISDHLDAAEVFPTTLNPDRQLLTNVGVMTSAGGLMAYKGGGFPAPFDGNITFITESVSNLVHVDLLRDSGASFVASRAWPNKEFLTSTDAWARPVKMYVGPDGALYVLDYYRRIIESPEWLSDEAIAEGHLYDGVNKGRIYRITPVNGKKADWMKGLHLGDASNEELVQNLDNPNQWWRINAQRILVDHSDKAAIAALEKMIKDAKTPFGRLHSLWTLEGMGELNPELIENALRDPVAGVRENAIKLAELHLTTTPELVKTLITLQNDPDPKVRFQLLLTLGFIDTPESFQARNNLLFKDINDKWVQIAALSARSKFTPSLLQIVLNKFDNKVPAYRSMVERLASMVGAGSTVGEIHSLIAKALAPQENEPEWKPAILEGIANGLRNRKPAVILSDTDQTALVKTFFQTASEKMRRASMQLLHANGITDNSLRKSSLDRAAKLVSDSSVADEKRADAISFLSIGDPAPYVPLLEKMLIPQERAAVQLAAIRTMSTIPGNEVSAYLIKQWPVLTNEIRDAVIGVLLRKSERMKLLVDALENGEISTSSVSFNQSVRLMLSEDDNLRKRARKLFTQNENKAAEINKKYQAALKLDGDPLKGRQVYNRNCAMCHQVRGELGVPFGPDLGTIHNWKKEDIMANILDPGLSISAGYELWEVEMNSGELVQGVMASETAAAITLKNNGKADRTINRQEIRSLKSLSISAMTSGLDKQIDKQQMADLLAFLRQN